MRDRVSGGVDVGDLLDRDALGLVRLGPERDLVAPLWVAGGSSDRVGLISAYGSVVDGRAGQSAIAASGRRG